MFLPLEQLVIMRSSKEAIMNIILIGVILILVNGYAYSRTKHWFNMFTLGWVASWTLFSGIQAL